MNSRPLRKLIRKYGALGYVVVGGYLLGYWLFHFKRKQTAVVLALLVLAASAALRLNTSVPSGDMEYTLIGREAVRTNAQSYTITDLGVVSGYAYSFGQHINAKGQTAGVLSDEEFEKMHSFFCTSNGKMSDIGTLGGDFSTTYGINDDGQIVGTSYTASQQLRGFVWQNGKTTSIGTLGGQLSIAEGINNKGQIVGVADTPDGKAHAFTWQNGDIKDISAQCPGSDNAASAINDNSDIAGIYTQDGETISAFLLSGGRSRTLPTLGGTFTLPIALSTKAVVGLGTLADGDEIVHGFVTTSGGIQDIGTFGGDNSFALGVNNSGVAVGMAQTKRGSLHAALWQSGKLTDLNTLLPSGSGWEVLVANGINERGQITGTGVVGNTIHAFLLTPKG